MTWKLITLEKALSDKILLLEQSIQFKKNDEWCREGTSFLSEQVRHIALGENRIFLFMKDDYVFPIYMPEINNRKDGLSYRETEETLKVLNEISIDKIGLFLNHSIINLGD